MQGQHRIRTLLGVGIVLSLCAVHSVAAQSAIGFETVVVDQHLSPAAGATLINAGGRILAQTEDRFVPLTLFEGGGRVKRTVNVSYRVAKLLLFDSPQENWLRVANHEVFGHGARLRELFDGPVDYFLPAPPPYGRGGGATSFQLDRPPTAEQLLAVTVGGMEANRMLARTLAQDAMTTGSWDYRDARRYLYAEYDTIRYILGTDEDEPEGHDVGDFLKTYNEVATTHGAKTLTARTLHHRVLAGFANPLIAYGYYSTYVSYLWGGSEAMHIPMLRFGATRYLPIVRFELTPFGTEWVIDNAFVRAGRFFNVSFRPGETVGARTWGIGAQSTRLAAWKGWTFDGEADLWHQPEWGGEAKVTAYRQIKTPSWMAGTLALVAQGGYKTNGFLAGEPIYDGGVFRIGVSLAP